MQGLRLSELKILLIIGITNVAFCLLAAAAIGAATAASGNFARAPVVSLDAAIDVFGPVESEGAIDVSLGHAEFVVVAVRIGSGVSVKEIQDSAIKISSGDCAVESPGINTIVQQIRGPNAATYNWVYSYFSRESNCSNIVGLIEQSSVNVYWEASTARAVAEQIVVSTGTLLNPHINHTFDIAANYTKRFGILLPQNKLTTVKCKMYVDDQTRVFLAEAFTVSTAVKNLIALAGNFPKTKESKFSGFIELEIKSSNEGLGIVDIYNMLPSAARASIYFEFEDIPQNVWTITRVATLAVSITAVLCSVFMFVFLIARGQQIQRLWQIAMDHDFDSNHGIDLEKLEKLRMLKFTSKLFQADESIRCAICLMDYEENQLLRFLPCGHHFHQACGDTWLLKKQSCPLCQQDVETAKDVRGPGRSPLQQQEEEESKPMLAMSPEDSSVVQELNETSNTE